MIRRGWTSLMVVTLVWAGDSSAQTARPDSATPAVSPSADGLREGDVVTIRTAGQPERRVRVTRLERFDAQNGLADVVDLASGSQYTVPLRMLIRTPRETPVMQTPAPVEVAPVSVSESPKLVAPVVVAAQHVEPTAPPTSNNSAWTARIKPPEPRQADTLTFAAEPRRVFAPAIPMTPPPLAVSPPPPPPRSLPGLNSVPSANPLLPSDAFAPIVQTGSAR